MGKKAAAKAKSKGDKEPAGSSPEEIAAAEAKAAAEKAAKEEEERCTFQSQSPFVSLLDQ